jgi:hypothetical protein
MALRRLVIALTDRAVAIRREGDSLLHRRNDLWRETMQLVSWYG